MCISLAWRGCSVTDCWTLSLEICSVKWSPRICILTRWRRHYWSKDHTLSTSVTSDTGVVSTVRSRGGMLPTTLSWYVCVQLLRQGRIWVGLWWVRSRKAGRENNWEQAVWAVVWRGESVSCFEGWRDHLKEENGFCWIFVESKIGQVGAYWIFEGL